MSLNQSATPPEFQLLVEALKAGLALFGGLVGAYIGTRWGLSRFKQERAYDKRLEWHLTALGVIHNLESMYASVDPMSPNRSDEFARAEKEFRRLMVEAEAFMVLSLTHALTDAYIAHDQARQRTLQLQSEGSPDVDSIITSLKKEEWPLVKAREVVMYQLRHLMPNDLERRLGPIRYFFWIRARRLREKFRPEK